MAGVLSATRLIIRSAVAASALASAESAAIAAPPLATAPAEPPAPPLAAEPAPTTEPMPTAEASPCGKADLSMVVCAVRTGKSVEPSDFDLFIHERPRSGWTLGLRTLSTLTTFTRRDALELHVGKIEDRRWGWRAIVRPFHSTKGNGGEVAVAALASYAPFSFGLEGGVSAGSALTPGGRRIATFSASLLFEYEVVTYDSFGLLLSSRLGFDFYENDNGKNVYSPLISIGIGMALFQTGE